MLIRALLRLQGEALLGQLSSSVGHKSYGAVSPDNYYMQGLAEITL